MKNNIPALITIFVIPLIYFYSESFAVLFSAITASGLCIYSLWQQKRFAILQSKQIKIILLIMLAWFFTVGESVWVSCSSYTSFPAFIKLCFLLLFTYGITTLLAIKPSICLCFYRFAAFTGFLQGVITICEYIEAPEIPKTWLDPSSKELFRTRCCGIMTDPNIYAAFLSVLFIFTIALIIRSNSKKEQIRACFSLVLSGTAIMMTLSRGSWIALLAALFTLTISMFIAKYKPSKTAIKLLIITSFVLLTIFFVGPFKYRLFSITKPSDMTFFQRTLINKGIFASLDKLPITGHGLHTFALVYPLYRIVGGDYPMYCHNEYLQSMIETGFLSSILLFLLTIYLLKLSYIAAKNNKFHTMFFSAAFISLLIHNLSGFSSRILPTSILIALSVSGILASQLKIKNITSKLNNKFNGKKLLNSSISLLIIFVLISSFNIFSIQKMLDEANIVQTTGNIQQALRIYENILKKQPNNSVASFALGMIQLLSKQPEKASETWKKAYELNKFEANFPINLARLYSKTNKEQAVFYYNKTLELDPASENFRLEYAEYLISQNKIDEAKSILNQALTYSPGFHNVYTGFLKIENLLSTLDNPNTPKF